MATGRKIETRGHIVGFREEIDNASHGGKDAFFTWFDSAENADTAFLRGQWDFMVHIGLPLAGYISNPEGKIALEIGHGGGRILLAACRSFKKVIGVDVHNNNRLVEAELRNRGASNFELFKTDGSTIPVEDSSVDIVYSFIVLQHVEKIDVFKRYLAETQRVLKPGGIAILYFGRKCVCSLNSSSRINYLIDCILERFLLIRGFEELPAKVNCKNLIVSLRYAEKLADGCGFLTLKKCVSHKKVPDGFSLYGGQHGLILKKP
ncbi:MAG: class I SAM-dependent methyltransferase [Phycisphaerae bacterium]|nr:class I SAM-dependent methyltransferase [Phycisphaerae bacterium]MDD5381702.1 class I SAM-dependent methyltransferase [Phycisphaerae bacterium]